MENTIMGFNQENLLKFNLDLLDMAILRYFIDVITPKKLQVTNIEGKVYYWVSYDEILSECPAFKIKKCTVQARFFKLRDQGILSHQVLKDGGNYSYFGIGKRYEELMVGMQLEDNEGIEVEIEKEENYEVQVDKKSEVKKDKSEVEEIKRVEKSKREIEEENIREVEEVEKVENFSRDNWGLRGVYKNLQPVEESSQEIEEDENENMDYMQYKGIGENFYGIVENQHKHEKSPCKSQNNLYPYAFKYITNNPSTKYPSIKNIKKLFSSRKRFVKLGDGDMKKDVLKLEDILKIKREDERISALYNIFNESSRLATKATQVEFLTTVRQIEKNLKPGMKILDLGAGTGEYSLYFANKGFQVTAIELVEKHVMQIKEKVKDDMSIEVFQGNALDISWIKDKEYDIVLCFGPLYHLKDIEDRMKCIAEVKRVCKDDGKIFFAFISNDMVVTTETMLYDEEFLKGNNYNHDTFKVVDFPFVFHTVDQCRSLLKDSNLKIISEVAADGLSELLADKINNMDEENYKQWLNYHYYCCEKPEFLGTSNHLLFVAEK